LKIRASLFFLFLLIVPAAGRDIDLDRIYLNKSYPFYHQLLNYRLEAYRRSGARFIDRNTIFVHWLSANQLIYLKEFSSATVIYRYDLRKSSRREIGRLTGTVTTSSLTNNGRFLVCKILYLSRDSLPYQKLCIVNCASGKIQYRTSNFPFKDYSHSPSGSGIIQEGKRGFFQFYPSAGIHRLLLPRKKYISHLATLNPRILLLSPDRLKKLVIAGSGGSYRSLLLSGTGIKKIADISSSRETCWLNNEEIIYRTGYSGRYSVKINNIVTDKTITLIKNTLNSGIAVSRETGLISFLDNQVIAIYPYRKGVPVCTGLEGDDISFSPSASRFATLLYGKCFIVRHTTLLRRLPSVKSQVILLQGLYRKLQHSKKYHINSYSSEYCRKKIQSYSRCIHQ